MTSLIELTKTAPRSFYLITCNAVSYDYNCNKFGGNVIIKDYGKSVSFNGYSILKKLLRVCDIDEGYIEFNSGYYLCWDV